ncbi:hypothetical protein BC834DRAFT_827096 [Gloeopeniophorella convolvens]|nr:hypothetical protein BC834DRAFT_827096 [Gloeopeniophorella convolvens]
MDGTDKPNAAPGWRTHASSALTTLAHGSVPFITTFLFIHLSAPAMANLGGASLSSQAMLLGREYYQTGFGERYLVFAPLLIHSTSALLKRLFSPQSPRPLSSALSATGYAVAFFFLPVHFITHRLGPADPAPPISSLGPSELDYEYVKAALAEWPSRSAMLYSVLALGVALHAADGIKIMWSTWAPNLKLPERRTRRALAAAGVLPVLTGLVVLAREPLLAFASTVERYHAALKHSFVYRL